MSEPPLSRRIRAARHLAGFRQVPELAKAIESLGALRTRSGLRATKLREYERGEDSPDAGQLAAIAEACGLPLEFFTADFSRLPEISENPRRVIAQELRAATERARARREDTPGGSRPQPAEARPQ